MSNFFQIKILGRTIEHLGVQLYNRRDTALAELVANAWDAGATELRITLPETDYNPESSEIIIVDNGYGMDESEIQSQYLVVGRNRRLDETSSSSAGRNVMGKKGLGKLAGFGIASEMKIETWKGSNGIRFILKSGELIEENNEAKNVNIPFENYQLAGNHTPTGTRITLSGLKHSTPLLSEKLHHALARRFSRTVQGIMKIYVNNIPLKSLELELDSKSPSYESEMLEDTLEDGNKVRYHYVFTDKPIHIQELRGFTILVNGKTAQAPDYYFSAETDATNQHSSKYLSGFIEADYLDDNSSSDHDPISTDRQNINWENPITKPLYKWGFELCKRIFKEIAERNKEEIEEFLSKDTELNSRIKGLDPHAQKTGKRIMTILQSYGSKESKIKAKDLASQVIRAYEYHNFIDVIEEIEVLADTDPEELESFLTKMQDWKLMESRAILEIINGRIAIIDKFHKMAVNNSPETANRNIGDNMHDLLASNPWLLNPDWQVFDEEKAISTQLKEWSYKDEVGEGKGLRYDFLGLTDKNTLIVIEIKRTDHALELEEYQKLQKYIHNLSKAQGQGSKIAVEGVLIYSGDNNFNVESNKTPNITLTTWGEIYVKVRTYYDHYRAVLEGDTLSASFINKTREVIKRKSSEEKGTIHRTKEDRKSGLGPQDYPVSKYSPEE